MRKRSRDTEWGLGIVQKVTDATKSEQKTGRQSRKFMAWHPYFTGQRTTKQFSQPVGWLNWPFLCFLQR